MSDLTLYKLRRRFGPSGPYCSMICSKKGKSVLIHIQGFEKIFHLSYQPLLTDSFLFGQLHAAAAWMDLQTDIHEQLGI